MELLLTHGYFLYEDPKELQIMKPYPPLGLLYICSHLRSKGFAVDVFDSTFQSRAALREKLVAAGLAPEAIDTIKAPAGLDLGAITPEEIAMSILAEITVERRRGQRGTSDHGH